MDSLYEHRRCDADRDPIRVVTGISSREFFSIGIKDLFTALIWAHIIGASNVCNAETFWRKFLSRLESEINPEHLAALTSATSDRDGILSSSALNKFAHRHGSLFCGYQKVCDSGRVVCLMGTMTRQVRGVGTLELIRPLLGVSVCKVSFSL